MLCLCFSDAAASAPPTATTTAAAVLPDPLAVTVARALSAFGAQRVERDPGAGRTGGAAVGAVLRVQQVARAQCVDAEYRVVARAGQLALSQEPLRPAAGDAGPEPVLGAAAERAVDPARAEDDAPEAAAAGGGPRTRAPRRRRSE